MAQDMQSVIWVDANGFTRLTTFNNDGNPALVNAEMVAVSNADHERAWDGPLVVSSSPAVTAAVYQSVQDAAILSFQDSAGSIVKITLPAPQLGIFAADLQTVDPTQIASLIAAVIAHVLSNAGLPVVSYLGGFYQRSGKVLVGG